MTWCVISWCCEPLLVKDTENFYFHTRFHLNISEIIEQKLENLAKTLYWFIPFDIALFYHLPPIIIKNAFACSLANILQTDFNWNFQKVTTNASLGDYHLEQT